MIIDYSTVDYESQRLGIQSPKTTDVISYGKDDEEGRSGCLWVVFKGLVEVTPSQGEQISLVLLQHQTYRTCQGGTLPRRQSYDTE